jgi:hypothetical protein
MRASQRSKRPRLAHSPYELNKGAALCVVESFGKNLPQHDDVRVMLGAAVVLRRAAQSEGEGGEQRNETPSGVRHRHMRHVSAHHRHAYSVSLIAFLYGDLLRSATSMVGVPHISLRSCCQVNTLSSEIGTTSARPARRAAH